MIKKKFCPWSFIGAAILGACTIIGKHFFDFGADPGYFGGLSGMLKYVPVMGVLMFLYYWLLYYLLNREYVKKNQVLNGRIGKIADFYEKHMGLITFLVIFICWLPYLFVFYPGSVCHDGYNQLNQSVGIRPISNKHPILGTYLLGIFFRVGRLINDNFGIFLYICFQTLVLASVFAFSVVQIRKIGMGLKACVSAMLYFALVPIWGAYTQAVVKDSFYSGIFLWFVLCFLNMADTLFDSDKKNPAGKQLLWFGISAFLVCALRQNGKYIVFPAVLALAVVSFRKWKKFFLVFLALLTVVTVYDKGIVPATGATPISRRAAYSVPFQQTAKYFREYPQEITEEEYNAVNQVLQADIIAQRYNPRLSDPVKNTFRNEASGEAVRDYLKVWFQMFWKHPGTYLEAFFQQCSGYLDPFHLNCPMGTFQNYIKGAPIATGDLDVHYIYGDQLRNRMSLYENTWMEIFPLTLLTYPGAYTWITLFCILFLCKKRKWKQLTVMLIPVFHILTCMASPVNGYLRYMLPLMAASPALLSWTLRKSMSD